MEYIDKLKTIQGNLPNLENKNKDELIKFINLLLNMSITREEGAAHLDELTSQFHKEEIKSLTDVALQIAEKGTHNFELIQKFESITSFKLNDELLNKLASGDLVLQ